MIWARDDVSDTFRIQITFKKLIEPGILFEVAIHDVVIFISTKRFQYERLSGLTRSLQ